VRVIRWILAAMSLAAALLACVDAQQHGDSCEIKSAEFATEYLYMSAGWVSQSPVLWSVLPQLASRRKQHGKWRVEKTTVGAKSFYRLWNHGAAAYLVNVASKPAAKKTTGGNEDELLWKLEVQKDKSVTLQQNGQYLGAKGEKSGDERDVLITPRSNKSTAKWVITC